MKNLLARVAGSLAQGVFLVHVGQHLARTDPLPGWAWGVLALLLVLGVAASWAQARLNAKRPALWTALVLMGLLPVGAFLAHRAPLDAPSGYGVVLLLNLVFGLLTLAFTAWLLAGRRAGAGDADEA